MLLAYVILGLVLSLANMTVIGLIIANKVVE